MYNVINTKINNKLRDVDIQSKNTSLNMVDAQPILSGIVKILPWIVELSHN